MNRYNIKLSIFGLLLMAASTVITLLLAGTEIFREIRFWCVFAPLLLGETVTFFPWLRLPGRSRTAEFPARTATAFLPAIYMGFTLLMLITYPARVPMTGICILQIVGLLALTGLFLFLSFFTDAIRGNSAETETNDTVRMNFMASFGAFEIILKKRFSNDKDFANKLEALHNKVRWAPTGVTGYENWDIAAAEKIDTIARAAGDKNKEEIIELMQQAEIALVQREEALKLAR